jgi:hypothetical protein
MISVTTSFITAPNNQEVFCLTKHGTLNLTKVTYLKSQLAYLFTPGTTWKIRLKRRLLNKIDDDISITLPVSMIDNGYYPNYKEHNITNLIFLPHDERTNLVNIIITIVSNDYSEVLNFIYMVNLISSSKWEESILINIQDLIDNIFTNLSIKKGLTYGGLSNIIKGYCRRWCCTAISLVSFKTHYRLIKSNHFGMTPAQRSLKLEQLTT